MCTVVVMHGVDPRRPLVVVANRDEVRDRPWAPPRVLHEEPRAVGGVDLGAPAVGPSAGSWMGANECGLFVALTNQRTSEPADRSRRSRGEVVTRALAARDPAEVEALLRTLDARAYNGFNLIFGRPGDVRVAYARSEHAAVEIERVAPGIAVLTNDRLRSQRGLLDVIVGACGHGRQGERLARGPSVPGSTGSLKPVDSVVEA